MRKAACIDKLPYLRDCDKKQMSLENDCSSDWDSTSVTQHKQHCHLQLSADEVQAAEVQADNMLLD